MVINEEQHDKEHLDPNQLAAELAQMEHQERQRERESLKEKRQRFKEKSTVSRVLDDLNKRQG